MTRLTTVALTLLLAAAGSAAGAGPIERACNASPRAGSAGALCACIQAVADRTLPRADQRRAARFFGDPHRAQEVRMSKAEADRAFWERYRGFGEAAEALCRPGASTG
jgi:hypothetical protein